MGARTATGPVTADGDAGGGAVARSDTSGDAKRTSQIVFSPKPMEKPGPSEAPLVAAVVRSEPASEYRLFAAAIREHVRHAAKPIQEPPAAQ